MASLFSSQLARIAANSSHEFDLRARKTSHGESLLFPRDVASKQDWDTIYAICIEGFREMRSLDPAFAQYERNLFSAQSKDQDREQMSKDENEALDAVIGRCLGLLGGKVLLSPGLRCVEWLVRRFRVHAYNTRDLLLMVLPYHEMPVWRNILSIIPQQNLVSEWKFLLPYHKDAGNVPKHTIVHAATNNDGFFMILNKYVPEMCQEGVAHDSLMRFWSGIVMEAVIGRLRAARSGRKELERQRMEDALLQILPIIADGLEVKNNAQMVTSCFTIAMILAAKADLSDKVLDSLLQAVSVAARSPEIDSHSAIITMVVLSAQQKERVLPKAGVDVLASFPDLESILQTINTSYSIGPLIESAIHTVLLASKRKNPTRRVSLIEKLLRWSAQNNKAAFTASMKTIISHLSISQTSDDSRIANRANVIDMLRRLNEDSSVSQLLAEMTHGSEEQKEQLEALMGTTVAMIEAPPKVAPDEMDVDVPPTLLESVKQSFAHLPTKTVNITSFLATFDRQLFEQLVDCFTLCCKSDATLAEFASFELWSATASTPLLYHSFLLRLALGPYPTRQRTSALFSLSNSVKQSNLDCQMIVPYVFAALSDPAVNVRRAAGDIMASIAVAAAQSMDSKEPEQLGKEELYAANMMKQVIWIPTNHIIDLLNQVAMPALEECILDASHISKVVGLALNGPPQPQPGMKIQHVELKKSLRHNLFDLLTTHAVATPLLRVQVDIVQMLEAVYKVGTTAKSKILMPILRSWAALSEADAQAAAGANKLDINYINTTMMQLITQEKDAVGYVLTMIEDEQISARSDLAAAFFNRLQNLWGDLKHETQTSCALKLFEFSFTGSEAVQIGAQSTLQNVTISTDILASILEQTTSGITHMQSEDQQSRKKRRTSNGRDSLPHQAAETLEVMSSRLTLALELVDNSNAGNRPELTPVLFDLLATLKRLKQQQRVDSPYLLNLCLSSILAIVDKQKLLSRKTLDIASIRADLVTDCIRSSENPQVQNTALLLSASLATLAPDRMLHNVMPIFTFVGQGVLSKEDDHSINVINQAIDQIVPAIIHSLKKQKRNMVTSTATLLASFAAAYNHIPPQRKVALYQRLLSRMGADEYTFVLIAMLTLRKSDKQNVNTFVDALLSEFSAFDQLSTYYKLLDLASDIVKKDSAYAEHVLDIDKSASIEERRRISGIIFGTALQVLRSKSLKSQISKMHKLDVESAETLRFQLASCFPQLLHCINAIGYKGHDSSIAKQCVDALLELPSLAELFNMMPRVSEILSNEPDLHAQALRVLISKVDDRVPKDSRTRDAAIGLLGNLTSYIDRPLENLQVKQAIIVCIDKLSEAYGRKDIQKVLEAASVVCGKWCLVGEQPVSDRRTKMMSLLCLASLLEVLKEACAPIVPDLFGVVLQMLDNTISKEEDEEMHNASYTLIAAIVVHVPYLVSDDNLAKLLIISSQSANAYDSTAATESRDEVLSTLGSKIDMSSLITAMSGTDLNLSKHYYRTAELEKLSLMSIAIEKAPKVSVVRCSDAISSFLLAHLDQRRRLAGITDEDTVAVVAKIESKINELSVQFIYKLNDTTFRPVFESWIEWGIKAYDLSYNTENDVPDSQIFRQTSLFNLLAHFFSTLKSIVTSYASYLIAPASTLLNEMITLSETKKFTLDDSRRDRYVSLLTLLSATFTHDADNFFASPSHFDPLGAPLISQLQLAASKQHRNLVYDTVLPTIISLATAVLDTPSHHQTLSHHIVQLRHSQSSAVRLASIKALAALSSDEEIGDDWIANTIGVGSATATDGDGVGIVRGGGSSAGEIMIYVNEMLEDDDEEVEMEVRRWVQAVREKVGEDVFEV